MSAITNDLDILQASIEANVLASQAVTTDLKKSESLDTLTDQQVAGALLTVDNQVDAIQTQINYLIQLDSGMDTTTDRAQDLQDTPLI
jgi:hypothetical protein